MWSKLAGRSKGWLARKGRAAVPLPRFTLTVQLGGPPCPSAFLPPSPSIPMWPCDLPLVSWVGLITAQEQSPCNWQAGPVLMCLGRVGNSPKAWSSQVRSHLDFSEAPWDSWCPKNGLGVLWSLLTSPSYVPPHKTTVVRNLWDTSQHRRSVFYLPEFNFFLFQLWKLSNK